MGKAITADGTSCGFMYCTYWGWYWGCGYSSSLTLTELDVWTYYNKCKPHTRALQPPTSSNYLTCPKFSPFIPFSQPFHYSLTSWARFAKCLPTHQLRPSSTLHELYAVLILLTNPSRTRSGSLQPNVFSAHLLEVTVAIRPTALPRSQIRRGERFSLVLWELSQNFKKSTMHKVFALLPIWTNFVMIGRNWKMKRKNLNADRISRLSQRVNDYCHMCLSDVGSPESLNKGLMRARGGGMGWRLFNRRRSQRSK